jgi:hypothetical protein
MSAAAVAATLALAGCPGSALRDVPAVITNPTAQSRAQLAGVVGRALNGTAVTVADDALIADDTLIVERTQRRDAQGRPLDGRETVRPEHFRLVKNGSRCLLVHERTARRWTLASTTCSPR